jgi:hypothetical protein
MGVLSFRSSLAKALVRSIRMAVPVMVRWVRSAGWEGQIFVVGATVVEGRFRDLSP